MHRDRCTTDQLTRRRRRLQQFLEGTIDIDFRAPDPAGRGSPGIEGDAAPLRLRPASGAPSAGLLLRFLDQASPATPRPQMKRLLKQFRTERHRCAIGVARRAGRLPIAITDGRRSKPWRTLDALHGNLSGPATRKLAAARLCICSATLRYGRLANISVAHFYNLRRAAGYQRARGEPCRTRPARSSARIGARRPPQPEGRPGFIRVDSVHQGDRDGLKGVYLINAVDTITQFQFIAAVERISEALSAPGAARFARRAFRSPCSAFTPITAASSSTIKWQSCSTSSTSNSPSRARAIATTTRLPKPRTAAIVRKHLRLRPHPRAFRRARQ